MDSILIGKDEYVPASSFMEGIVCEFTGEFTGTVPMTLRYENRKI